MPSGGPGLFSQYKSSIVKHKRLLAGGLALLVLAAALMSCQGAGGLVPRAEETPAGASDEKAGSGSDPDQAEIDQARKLFAEQWDSEALGDKTQPVTEEAGSEELPGETLSPTETVLATSSPRQTAKTTARKQTKTSRTTAPPSTTAWPISGTTAYPYLIYVSKNSLTIQILGLDGNNQYTRELRRFSTGIGRNAAQTRTGTFTVTGKESWHTWKNRPPTYSPYVTSYSGGVWIHGPIYAEMDPNQMLPGSYNAIGTACSAGCLRTTCSAAAWIYYNCRVGTTVIVANDSRYVAARPAQVPLEQTWDPTDPRATPEIPVTSFSLNAPQLSLTAGQTATLFPVSIQPANTSTSKWRYESKNPSIAKVDGSGKVTALAAGATEIVVTADDIYGRYRTCQITVNPAPTSPPTSSTSTGTTTASVETTAATTQTTSSTLPATTETETSPAVTSTSSQTSE